MNYLNQFYTFISDTLKSRKLIFELAKKDFRAKYLGSYLGMLWAFVQPTITILIFWFVFQLGFKSRPVDNFPFILWLLCGMVPWFFFSEAVSNATNAVIENSYLVKKVVFRVSVLPIIKIISALFIHLFFIIFLFIMFLVYGYKPSIYSFQVIYYLFATIVLALGISWITSSLVVFLKDIGQVVGMLLQFGFWLTPIFWSLKLVPEKYHIFLKLNPIYYIVEGYRNTFIYHSWFWQSPRQASYFWIITLVLFVIGALIFKRLRPHFADVL
ncbi:MAG: teichoic acid ABC transporter permease [Firmicutes bacterium HGW-Firmicutes-8]|nr:MAG: teichoic acid ABC transporter permease [Firmicutes bacterium HGW-Firmicutes-8]